MTTLIDLKEDVRLDSTETLSYKLPANDPKIELVVEDQEFAWGGKRWITRQTEMVRQGATLMLSVEADALWYRLGEYTRVGSTFLDGVSAADGLDAILDGTGWTRGVSTASTAASATPFSLEAQDETALWFVRSWAEVCGLVVVFDTVARTVDLVESRGRNLGTAFRYGRNLESIKRRVVPPQCTRLYAYGADSLSFAGINAGKSYVEDYSWYTDQGLTLSEARDRYTKTKVLSDTRFLTDADLLPWARVQIADLAQPTISYECKVSDLSGLNVPGNDVQVGDLAIVRDGPLGIEVQTTVVRLVRYPAQPWRNEIELAYLYRGTNVSNSRNQRPAAALQWLMFKSDNPDISSRFDGSATLNRIGLKFREGGEAVFGYDINFRGVGTGSVSVSAIEWNAGDPILMHEPLTLPYADGQVVHENMTWALKDLSGIKDYRIRMVPTADGGPAVSAGVDVNEADSRFWILAHGAVQETPVNPTEEVFLFNGSNQGTSGTVQQFVIPDGITEIQVVAVGAAGGSASLGAPAAGQGGAGSSVTAKLTVVPGQIIDVYVGGCPGGNYLGSGPDELPGWPNGGNGGPFRSGATRTGGGGGGASFIVPEGATIADAWIVAPGGGGECEDGTGKGGDSGFYAGEDGDGGAPGRGATQYAGGAAGGGGQAGSFGQGGNAAVGTSIFSYWGGGGGGGWYGGGGSDRNTDSSGGGGSGWIDFDRCYDTTFSDAVNTSTSADMYQAPSGSGSSVKPHGRVTISWEVPD